MAVLAMLFVIFVVLSTWAKGGSSDEDYFDTGVYMIKSFAKFIGLILLVSCVIFVFEGVFFSPWVITFSALALCASLSTYVIMLFGSYPLRSVAFSIFISIVTFLLGMELSFFCAGAILGVLVNLISFNFHDLLFAVQTSGESLARSISYQESETYYNTVMIGSIIIQTLLLMFSPEE